MWIFYISCTVIVCIGFYLTVAQCYKTGFLGAVGFGVAGFGAGTFLFEMIQGVQYEITFETICVTTGMALYLIQTAWRARHHGVKARNRRKSDCAQAINA